MRASELPTKVPVPLTETRCHEFEVVARTVVDQTVALYAQHLQRDPIKRVPDSRQWKLLKTKDDIFIYMARDANPTTVLYAAAPPPDEVIRDLADWKPQSKIHCLGKIMGSLDDAMYGVATPTETNMGMRSMYVRDELVEHRVVADIRDPTEDEPFTYTSLKWSTRDSYVAGIVKPRDMVYVESAGFTHVMHMGKLERVGYLVSHSVNLGELPPMLDQGFLRARFSLCVLFRQAGPTVVDVFSLISSDPAGELPRKVTSVLAASALLSVHKVTESAMKKKLVWMQAARSYAVGAPSRSSTSRPRNRSSSLITRRESRRSMNSGSTCPQCSRDLSVLRSLTTCQICEVAVCSRCSTSLKLVVGQTKRELQCKDTNLCKGCITTARRLDNARQLAVYEFVHQFDRSLTEESPMGSRTGTFESTTSITLLDDSIPVPRSTTVPEVKMHLQEDEDEVEVVSTRGMRRRAESMVKERLRLWKQINELCAQAETTYVMARQQTLAILERTPAE